MQALAAQRNQALDTIANLAGEIEVLKEEIERLKAEALTKKEKK